MSIRNIVTICLIAFANEFSLAQEIYDDYINGFNVNIDAERNFRNELFFDNACSAAPIVKTFQFLNPLQEEYCYKVRFRDGEDLTRKQRFLSQELPTNEFGIVWNYKDANNYVAAIFNRVAENKYDEICRNDYLRCRTISVNGGKATILNEAKLFKPTSVKPEEFNTLGIAVKGGKLHVVAGHSSMTSVCSFSCDSITESNNVGIYIGAGCRLAVKRIETSFTKDLSKHNQTTFDKLTVDKLINQNHSDPIVGYWQYADRSTDDKLFILGGKYQIAIIPNGSGKYDILYISGASKYPEYWRPYMKKGELKSTPFFNHYDLAWFSSLKQLFDDESYASISEGILSLYFPVQKSTVRFYRTFTEPTGNP